MDNIDKEFYKRLDEVLHYMWDPIGISGAPGARDEYYSYLGPAFALIKQNCSVKELAKYLDDAQNELIGMGSELEKNEKIANIIFEWKNALYTT